jgi:chromosome partitioning protein
MPTVALVSNKGGSGKTTLSMNLAAGLSRRGSTVLLDADPQGSSAQWAMIADEAGIVESGVVPAHEAVGDRIAEYRDRCNYRLVDCPPSIHAPQTRSALEYADIALIPVQPSPVDLWATAHIARVVEQVREGNGKLAAFLIVNQLESRTLLSRLVGSTLSELELPALRTTVHRRAVYRNCVLEGRSVYQMGARGAPAIDEIEGIIQEVFLP